jgi:peptidoglycan hydrolase-like protein with peptidoglycan-binding domain
MHATGYCLFIALLAAPSTGSAEGSTTIAIDSRCPRLTSTFSRGIGRTTDATTGGQVSELQRFLAGYSGLDTTNAVTGTFGPLTQRTVHRFQKEQGMPTTGSVGPMTRARIHALCAKTSANQQQPTPPAQSSTPEAELLATFYASAGTGNLGRYATKAIPVVSVAQYRDGKLLKWLAKDLQGSKSSLGAVFPGSEDVYNFTWFMKDAEIDPSARSTEVEIRIFGKKPAGRTTPQ